MNAALPPSLALVGAGKMGGAMLEGWLAIGLPPDAVTVFDAHPSDDIRLLCETKGLALNPDDAPSPAVLVLATKPQTLEIVAPLVEGLVSPETVLVMVANPLDAMCHVAFETSGFPRERVVGMAGILDTARYRTFIAQELRVSVREVFALVLGGHGDNMVPLPSMATVSGRSITDLLPQDRVDAIVQRTRQGGGEIVELLGSGSAFYAPAAAIVEMADAILLDQKRILPCATYLQGEYGINDLFVGVPVKLGAGGVEEVIELDLTDDELADLENSANDVRNMVEVLHG